MRNYVRIGFMHKKLMFSNRPYPSRNSRGRYKSQEDVPYRKDLRDLEPDQFETDQVQGNTSWVHSRKQSEFDVDDYDDVDGEFTNFQKAGPIQVK